jgi:hypothetical protein
MSEAGDFVEFILLYTCRFSIFVYQTSFPNYMSKIISIDFSLMHSLSTRITSKYLNIDTRSDQILVNNVYRFCITKVKGILFSYTPLGHTRRAKE